MNRAVGGRQHPDIDSCFRRPAQPAEFGFLQHAQEPGLHGQRHLSNLIEQKSPSASLLETSGPPANGARKGALLVAE
jgi:hypothetical protein